MTQNELPTKANLIQIQQTLTLAQQAHSLLDQKRKALIREMSSTKKTATHLKTQMNESLTKAKAAITTANITMGRDHVESTATSTSIENTIQVQSRNIMGIEIPLTSCDHKKTNSPPYPLASTSSTLDEAYTRFNEVKSLIVTLAAAENKASRLEAAIAKTKKRANALQHIIIPRYEARLKFIQNALEERERDSFVRLKLSKPQQSLVAP